MEEYSLDATAVSLDRDDKAIVLSFGRVSNAGDILGYVMLQKSTLPDDQSGVYLEINDQINSGYGLITRVEQARGKITIQLKKPLSRNMPTLIITVRYPITNERAVKQGLRLIK